MAPRPLTTRTAMAATRRAGVRDRFASKRGSVIRLGIAPADSERAIEALRAVWPDAPVTYDAIGHTVEIDTS